VEEKILVVPRDKLFADMDTPQGFGRAGLEQLVERIRDFHEFAGRRAAEEDPSLKQIIPYMVLCCGQKVFLMRRFDNQDEERLRNLYSLGVGGHVNQTDDSPHESTLAAGLERELREEVEIPGSFALQPVGYINDETNAVGQVHFGLAYRVSVRTEDVAVRESDIMSGSFVTIPEARSVYPEMETWSQIVFRNMDAFIPGAGELAPES
jgi:predicted NUDIX family phosphoesterase